MLVGYLRTGDQDTDNSVLVERLKSAGCERIAFDEQFDREFSELITVLETMESGDFLVVLRLEELARSLKELNRISEVLQERNIHLCSIKENLDTTSKDGRRFLRHLAIVAEFDRCVGKIRGQESNNLARARGRITGRPPSLDDKQVAEARVLRNQSMPIKKISQKLGVSKSTLYRHLSKEEGLASVAI